MVFNKYSSHDEIENELRKLYINQMKLFSADCARSVLHHFEDKFPNDKRPRLVIEMAESLRYNAKVVRNAWNAVDWSVGSATPVNHATTSAVYTADAHHAAYAVSYAVKAGQSWEFINSLFEHANKHNPFPNQWKTPDVLNISKVIIQERDFDSCKFLADALTDAGCDDDTLLNHLRTDTIGLSDWTLFNLRQDALLV
jgi:hypothetical protein